MKRNMACKKLSPLDIARMFFLFLAFVWGWDVVWRLQGKELYRSYHSLIYLFVSFAFYLVVKIWKERAALRKSDYAGLEKDLRSRLKQKEQKKQLNQKEYREYIELHMELLWVDLILGRYDEYLKEWEKLYDMSSYLTQMQKLQLWLASIDYIAFTPKVACAEDKLEKAGWEFQQLEGISGRMKREAGKKIRLARYLVGEKWEDVLELLNMASNSLKKRGILEQVIVAFIRGNCYYKLGSYEKAYVELQFAVKWGCDTKYALMAKDILEIIPGKEQYEAKSDRKLKSLKYKGIGKVILLAVDCFIIVLLGVVYNDCSYGSSMEEAYRKRYLCAENEPIVLYSEKIDDYELAILEEGEKTVYGLFSKPADSDYKIEKFLFVYNHTGEDPMEKYELELTEVLLNYS